MYELYEKMKKIIVAWSILTISVVLPVTAGLDIITDNLSKEQIPGITFYQIDYQLGEKSFFNSNTGKIVVNVETALKTTRYNSGFINGYTNEGWVIQNLFLIEDYPYETISTYFDLGQTRAIRAINIYLEISKEPLHRFSNGIMVTYPIFDAIVNIGGDKENPGIFKDINPPAPGMVEFEMGETSISYVQPNHHPEANVETAVAQCVPLFMMFLLPLF